MTESGIAGRIVALAGAGLLLAAGTVRAGGDWPNFLGPEGHPVSNETGLSLDWPSAGPPILWETALGQGYSMPSVAGGRVFVFDRKGDEARLTCLDAKTGKQLWRSSYPTNYEDTYGFSNGPRTSPVVDEGRVYTFGVEGRLRCHDTSDGKLRWDVDTAATFGVVQNFFGVGSTPRVEGELLIASIGGSTKGVSNGSGIVAFDKKTGEVRYKIGDELAGYSSPVMATIGERRWGFVFARGGLVGFEPTRGKIDFVFPWRAKKRESVNAANPVVVGDTVFITESYGPGGALLKVRRGGVDLVRQDDPRSRDKSLMSHWATPIYRDGYLYGCHGSGSGEAELRAVNFRTGKVAWRKPGLGRVTLTYVDGHLLVLTERGRLIVIEANPEKFVKVAELPLVSYPAWNAPVVAGSQLYVRGKKRLVCLDLKP